ncbi:MAG: enoyl-CoA hydratase/isomerase family protein [Hyphomicrobiaceae bacterium]|nr:enoyl-CoA hydratase/isomerase family protein [Hyphomicrobiaceae bacterium]
MERAQLAAAGQEIVYEVRDRIGFATFNRPQARNALTFGMYDRLAEICVTAPTDGSVMAIVISGAGERAFAAGTDISLFRDFRTPEQGIAYEKRADEVFTAIESCPVPTIAAIAGACTGGGAGIAACCDMRIATRDMKFGFPIARTLGNCLSAASLERLVRLVGEARVTDLIFTARLVEAEEARAVGLVSEVVESHAALMARAEELARQIAGHAPLTLRITKELLRRLRRRGPKVDDTDLVARCYTSADFREGLEAFLAKRPAKWTGR